METLPDQLAVLPIFGGVPEKILESVHSPVTISPDGKSIAFVRFDEERKLTILIVADLEKNGAEKELAARPVETGFDQSGADWSPDGKFIAVGATNEEEKPSQYVLLVNASDGSTEKFSDKTWRRLGGVSWLKDGSGLFVNITEQTETKDLWLIERAGKTVHKVTRDTSSYSHKSLSVSDDGTKLLAVNENKFSSISVIPIANPNQIKHLTSSSFGKAEGMNGMVWASNGDLIFARNLSGEGSIWKMDGEGNNKKQLTSGDYDHYPAVAGEEFVLFDSTRVGEWNVWRASLKNGELKQLTTHGGLRPDATPDGKWVLYVNYPGTYGSIWKVSIDGGEPVRLTDGLGENPVVSPDGKTFAWIYKAESDKKSKLTIFPIEGGSPLAKFELRGGALRFTLIWTRDGKSLIYADLNGSLAAEYLRRQASKNPANSRRNYLRP